MRRIIGLAVLAGSALPAYAQFAIVSDLPGSFTEIRSTGIPIVSGDDESAPFTSSVTNALVPVANLFANTNGAVTGSYFTYGNLPLPAGVTLGLFPFWEDLVVDSPGKVIHQAVVENGVNVEIVEWSQVRTYWAGAGSPTGTFQLKLFSSGPIYAQFIEQDTAFAGGGIDTTSGVQWGENSYFQYSHNASVLTSGVVLSVVSADAGRCCLTNGSCTVTSSSLCAAQSGEYAGNNTSCSDPCPMGACCLNMVCAVRTHSACIAQGGIYRGDGVTCSAANCPGSVLGPDVQTAAITDVINFGIVGAITAYAVGTTSCNNGDAPVDWIANSNRHPVIAQNMYRLKNGRFEQLGQSWLKHGSYSTNSTGLCGTCIPPGGGNQQLGIHCSDVYSAGLNGGQGHLGPRYEVNPFTGAFAYPFTAANQEGDAIYKRLQVLTANVTPALNQGARYFVEGHYVAPDDAASNNGLNNSSFQEVTIASTTANPVLVGPLHQGVLPIQAWSLHDPLVITAHADDVVGGVIARFGIAGRCTDNGNGTWHYEYAVYNHNSDRAGGSFAVPVSSGVAVSNIEFSAPFSHSGEPFSNAAWGASTAGGAVTWSTDPYGTNVNANAIRWGTMYNFRFDANTPPISGVLALGLFKPGSPSVLSVGDMPVPAAMCYANCDHSTVLPALNANDFQCFLNQFAAGDSAANCDQSTAAPVLNANDFQCFLNSFAAGCP